MMPLHLIEVTMNSTGCGLSASILDFPCTYSSCGLADGQYSHPAA